MPDLERSRIRIRTPEALANSRVAHSASLLFRLASETWAASAAIQAVFVSLAFREGSQSPSLTEMSTCLLGDPQKIKSMLGYAEVKHGEHNVDIREDWKEIAPFLIKRVFGLADKLLVVDRATLEPYFLRHTSIIDDIRNPDEETLSVESQVRKELESLALTHSATSSFDK